MPWKEVTQMSQREEFIQFAMKPDANFSALCRRFGISRKTGYKWLNRYKDSDQEGEALNDQSRRPHSHPSMTPAKIQQCILKAREQHPAWGGRKLKAWLESKGFRDVPTASTITKILQKHGYIDSNNYQKQTSWHRFEHPCPNDLWQVDFKGYFEMHRGQCHPLTILDDHSRYSVLLRACAREDGETVKSAMIDTFRHYGLPFRMNFDNGHPWGHHTTRYTQFSLWLMRLGIHVSYSSIGHPQTNGKDERFHRTLKAELLNYETFYDLMHAQQKFNQWREIYNQERPHESLNLQPPITRYQPSERLYPEILPSIEYDKDCILRSISNRGYLRFKGRFLFLGKAFINEFVGVKENPIQECYEIYYGHQLIRSFKEEDLRSK